MKQRIFSTFDLSVLTGNKKIVHRDSEGNIITPISALVNPNQKDTFNEGVVTSNPLPSHEGRTVIPTGWMGANATEQDINNWMAQHRVGTTFSRFDGVKGTLKMERYVRGEA